jgi:hypothetical protein
MKWVYDEYFNIVKQDELTVCNLNESDFAEDKANGGLIASAPELLRKLKETVAVMENEEKVNMRIWAHQLKIAVMEAKELIERIEGES